MPVASIGNRWKAELASRNPAGSVKWPSLMNWRRRLGQPPVLGELLGGEPAHDELRRSQFERHPGVERLVGVDGLDVDSPISLTTPEPENFS